MNLGNRLVWVAVLAGGSLALGAAAAAGAKGDGAGDAPYTVKCISAKNECYVDKATYIGWRTFNGSCAQCHAKDAVGSTFAPSLVERLKYVDRDRFMNHVRNGFQGQIGVMPAWKDNPNVAPRLDDIYAYLKARSDGALPPGRPGRLKDMAKN